jgi:hypothetical protein
MAQARCHPNHRSHYPLRERKRSRTLRSPKRSPPTSPRTLHSRYYQFLPRSFCANQHQVIRLHGTRVAEIIGRIADARDHGRRIPSFRFFWPPDQVDTVVSQLLVELDGIGVGEARFEYDYQSHIAFLDMSESGESTSHSISAARLDKIVTTGREKAFLTIKDAEVRKRAVWITSFRTAAIKIEGDLYKMPDGSFGPILGQGAMLDSEGSDAKVSHSDTRRSHRVSLVIEVS